MPLEVIINDAMLFSYLNATSVFTVSFVHFLSDMTAGEIIRVEPQQQQLQRSHVSKET